MTNANTTATTPELENTVKEHLANDQTDTGLVRSLVNAVVRERGQDTDELAEELVSAYEEWAYATKEVEFANDTYYNAETGSDDEEEAEQAKNAAEEEASSQVSELRRALSDFLDNA